MRNVQTNQRGSNGFTLVEVSMAMVIIGVSVVAMLQLLAAGTQSNIAGNELTTAVNLANNIKEISSALSYTDPVNPTSPNTQPGVIATANDIWDLNGCVISPPVDCNIQPIADYSLWKQVISVRSVSPTQLSATRPNDPTIPTARITVTIYHASQSVYQTSWIACAPDGP